jgi:hypothetical protein
MSRCYTILDIAHFASTHVRSSLPSGIAYRIKQLFTRSNPIRFQGSPSGGKVRRLAQVPSFSVASGAFVPFVSLVAMLFSPD